MNIFKQTVEVFLVAGLAICLMGQLGCPPMPSEPPAENGKIQKIKVDESFDITLVSNATTGYSWEANFDEEFLALVQSEYIPDKPELIGSGGVEKFTFTGLKVGTTEITMNYRRPWEEVSIETQVFTVIIE
jgi:predicted secreted protein